MACVDIVRYTPNMKAFLGVMREDCANWHDPRLCDAIRSNYGDLWRDPVGYPDPCGVVSGHKKGPNVVSVRALCGCVVG